MPQRKTQSAQYWVETFEVEQADIDHLYSVLLERETPLSVDEMALVLARYRVQQEEAALAGQREQGNAYQPHKTYQVSDQITFPKLNHATGKVISTRPGDNPEYGPFTVIRVEFELGGVREFASQLLSEHALNVDENDLVSDEENPLTPEDLFIEYGGEVAKALEDRLASHDDLVRVAGRWFPRSLLAEINIGHLNLAEAVLDMNGGGPMSTPDVLQQIGMLDDINDRLAEFSMNYALQEDPRFDEVGPAGQVLWYLTRMEPPETQRIIPRLEYEPIDYDETVLTEELRDLEREIDDEHSPLSVKRRRTAPDSVTITLTFPHWRMGTLPLSAQLKPLFPTAYEAPRIRFTLVDGTSGEEMPGWVVRSGRYVFGLAEWYRNYQVPVGGYLSISRTDDPGKVRIDYAQRKPRTEWVRTASVGENRLHFENTTHAIACEYDELMMIYTEDTEEIDTLGARLSERRVPLQNLMKDLFPELAKLNPQGAVHAKTLYTAINVVRRCPPGPIFVNLVALPDFVHVGGPYWRLDTRA